MAPVIRPYRPEDRAAVQRVYHRAIMEGTADHLTLDQRAAWAGSPDPDPDEPDKLLDQWCWVAWEGARATGFMSLCRDGLLDMAFVIPEVMGKGTADALYDALLLKAREKHLPRLTVQASVFSRGFLVKRGWQVDSEGMQEFDGHSYHLSRMSLAPG
jgi:putative acetyltransferase